MSNMILNYELKCHSPLIHFQPDQPGATLRATEVKPKLDRFLKKRYGDTILKEWKMDPDKDALRYKMHFKVKGRQEIVELGMRTDYEIFYGNMGDGTVRKKGVLGNVSLQIICAIPELRKLIDESIAEFFVVTNFGTMQNKGFGSYTVVGKNLSPNELAGILKAEYGAQKCYMFQGGEKPFARIKTVYGMIKSGVNFRNYQRSLLFLFLHQHKKIGNEKAWLKQNGYAPSDVGQNAGRYPKNDPHPSYYVRALLGIGDHIDFINDLNNRGNKTTVSIKCDRGGIERLHSPILFKVIENNVYYVAQRIDERIYGTTFRFSSPRGGGGSLTVPTKEVLGEAFIDEFLAYCEKELNGGALGKFRDTQNIRIQGV